MVKNRPSETIHFRMAPLTGPPAKEKLTQISRPAEFWLMQLAAWAVHRIGIECNRSFGSILHTL